MAAAELPKGSVYDLVFHKTAPVKAGAGYYEVHKTDLEHVAEKDAVGKEDQGLIGYVHSTVLGSTVDGPGLRFVGFLTGCLLRCQYCHNPDTWHKRNGTPVSVEQAMREIGKYAQVLKTSKGGVTLSGGEPMVQAAFTTRIFKRCKALGLHTCLDTSGRLGERLTDEQLMDVDLNLLDIKSGDPEIYRKLTRHPLQPTLDYAQRLSELGRKMWIRYVLVPGLTDGIDNVQRVADFCAGLKGIERVEILRFHQLGKSKWEKLGIEYPLQDVQPPSAELTERVREQFRSRGFTVF